MGVYTTTGWNCDEKIDIDYPKISRNNIIQIKEYIETTTKKRTNNTATISNEPIFMKIFAPNGTNLIFVRELTSGIYFGDRGRKDNGNTAFDTCTYKRDEIIRLAKKGFVLSMKRSKKLYT